MKLAISAPRGKMGKLVTREALKRSGDFEIVGGIGPKGRDYIGCDMSVAAKTDFVGANTYDDVEKVVAMSDGVVDFSTTEGAMEVARALQRSRWLSLRSAPRPSPYSSPTTRQRPLIWYTR